MKSLVDVKLSRGRRRRKARGILKGFIALILLMFVGLSSSCLGYIPLEAAQENVNVYPPRFLSVTPVLTRQTLLKNQSISFSITITDDDKTDDLFVYWLLDADKNKPNIATICTNTFRQSEALQGKEQDEITFDAFCKLEYDNLAVKPGATQIFKIVVGDRLPDSVLPQPDGTISWGDGAKTIEKVFVIEVEK